MRFDCGPTPEEKFAGLEAKARRLREWHVWFAWYPVRTGPHDCRWLERVERRYPEAWAGLRYLRVYYEYPKYRARH